VCVCVCVVIFLVVHLLHLLECMYRCNYLCFRAPPMWSERQRGTLVQALCRLPRTRSNHTQSVRHMSALAFLLPKIDSCTFFPSFFCHPGAFNPLPLPFSRAFGLAAAVTVGLLCLGLGLIGQDPTGPLTTLDFNASNLAGACFMSVTPLPASLQTPCF
jgi:hypothetical protein